VNSFFEIELGVWLLVDKAHGLLGGASLEDMFS